MEVDIKPNKIVIVNPAPYQRLRSLLKLMSQDGAYEILFKLSLEPRTRYEKLKPSNSVPDRIIVYCNK